MGENIAIEQLQKGTLTGGLSEQSANRLADLLASDPQLSETLSDPAINEAKTCPDLGLAQIMAICMEGYANRPALAQRTAELIVDPATGRTARKLLQRFDAITYRELWARVRALATVWQRDTARALGANDLICILGSSGIDFATIDLAGIHNGAVCVPMQVNAAFQQLLAMFNEVAPNWLATSPAYVTTAVELILQGHRPNGLLLFEYNPEVDDERELFESAQAKLADAGMADLLVTLQSLRARGQDLPVAPIFAEPATTQRMCTIYYTSGSTGLPKGAMIPELMLTPAWTSISPIPLIGILYLPLSHSAGRSRLFSTLAGGGVGYFTANSDLSELFEDIRMARPTSIGMVPRICEMVYQQYQVELERRRPDAASLETLKRELAREMRDNVLGGRLLTCSIYSAPLAPDLRAFMDDCLGFPIDESYGATEISAAIRNTRIRRPPVIDYKLDDVPELGYFKTDQPHARGELLVKTHTVMLGYYQRPHVTAQVFDEQGYYKTGDIMAEIGPDQLIYVDRRNNVLKLAQGEFVAIARLEALYTNGHPAIRQAYLYGTSVRSYLLGVLVPNMDTMQQMGIAGDEDAIRSALRQAIKEVARTEQLSTFEVPRDFIIEYEPFSVENGLLAGIAKYQRPKFKERYAQQLELLYEQIAANQNAELEALRRNGGEAPILETVGRAVRATLSLETLDMSQRCSFTELGGDSLSALTCSLLLEEIYKLEVPVAVINNPAGGLQELARYIERARSGRLEGASFASVHGCGALEIHASDLTLDKFLDANVLDAARKAQPCAAKIRTVLVTGANGFLGRFLCLEWLERMAAIDGRVVCIARGESAADAKQRITDAFNSGDPELKSRFEQLASDHLEVLAGDLGVGLGLSQCDWERLSETVDLIVHPAAFVNHVLSYQQLFGPNVMGTAEVIRLAITHRLKPINHISTVAAAMMPGGGSIDEDADVRVTTPIRSLDDNRYAGGYANSKWAAEVLLRDAHERFGLAVSVFRSDMILAHSRYIGQINVPDMFTRWLFSIMVTGLAPRSFYTGDVAAAHYRGLPVDFTAEAIATLGGGALAGYQTYHVINPHDDGISLDSFVDWAIAAGHEIHQIEDYADWYGRFETALRALPDLQRPHTTHPMLQQFRRPIPASHDPAVPAARFRAEIIRHGVGADKDIPHLSAGLIRKYLDDFRHLSLI